MNAGFSEADHLWAERNMRITLQLEMFILTKQNKKNRSTYSTVFMMPAGLCVFVLFGKSISLEAVAFAAALSFPIYSLFYLIGQRFQVVHSLFEEQKYIKSVSSYPILTLLRRNILLDAFYFFIWGCDIFSIRFSNGKLMETAVLFALVLPFYIVIDLLSFLLNFYRK